MLNKLLLAMTEMLVFAAFLTTVMAAVYVLSILAE